ncbi:MAG: Ldh family oxidoreductase [Anaerolineae bacterium]
MHIISAPDLRRFVTAILEAAATPPDVATLVADSLVEANLAGHDSHGVIRVSQYIDTIREGTLIPDARPSVVARHGATAQVDAGWGWGPPAALLAADTAIDLARQFGVAAVTVQRCNHIGRVGLYTGHIAEAGMAAIALANVRAWVAPYGGRERMMGTNPLSWAVPRAPGQPPLVLDFATSVLAEGKVRVARDKDMPVPSGVVVDSAGRPTQTPDDLYDGGALLPFGLYKGYGISVMIELLGGILSGQGPSVLPSFSHGNGTLILAINIEVFAPLAEFIEQTEAYAARLKASLPSEGSAGVLLPGEPEQISQAQRLVDGIPLPDQTWATLQATAQSLGVG